MQCIVVPTHVLGRRRTKEEMATAEQFTGVLSVGFYQVNPREIPKLAAVLTTPNDRFNRKVLFPLYDVKLEKLSAKGLLLSGYQIHSERVDGKHVSQEYIQGWWAKFVQPPEAED